MTSEQRPPLYNGHYVGVTRVVVVHRFDNEEYGYLKFNVQLYIIVLDDFF